MPSPWVPKGALRPGENWVTMPLLLREADVARVLKMDDVIRAVEDAFRHLGQHKAVNRPRQRSTTATGTVLHVMSAALPPTSRAGRRSEEHTSELQSRSDLVCRLLLEKKKKNTICAATPTIKKCEPKQH